MSRAIPIALCALALLAVGCAGGRESRKLEGGAPGARTSCPLSEEAGGTPALPGICNVRRGDRGKVTQFSTIDALLAGVYDGAFPCRKVAARGNLGLGTFDRLDGEMVVAEGRIFQVRADGTVHRVPGSLTTPFATVARFRADLECSTSAPLTLRALEAQLDRVLPNPNAIYAIRLRGEFPVMKTRSVPAQKKPYPALVDAAKGQSVFALGPARGTVVGFRFPPSCRGLNVPGYHLHFLSEDRMSGGHILDMTAAAGLRIEAQEAGRYEVVLPRGEGGFSRASLGRDRSGELQKVER